MQNTVPWESNRGVRCVSCELMILLLRLSKLLRWSKLLPTTASLFVAAHEGAYMWFTVFCLAGLTIWFYNTVLNYDVEARLLVLNSCNDSGRSLITDLVVVMWQQCLIPTVESDVLIKHVQCNGLAYHVVHMCC